MRRLLVILMLVSVAAFVTPAAWGGKYMSHLLSDAGY